MLPHPTLDKLQTLRLHGMLKALPAALWLQFNWPGGLGGPGLEDGAAPVEDGVLALRLFKSNREAGLILLAAIAFNGLAF